MATKTFTVTKQFMADNKAGGGSGAANPGDLHIPIGRWDPGTGLPWQTRALLYAPVSFTGMTAINGARLYLRAHVPGSGWHAKGTTTTTINARRKTAGWSETSGGVSSAVDEIWGTDGSAFVNDNITSQAGDQGTFPSMVHNDWYFIDITPAVTAWFGGAANNGLMIYNNGSASNPAFAKEFWSRHQSGSEPYIWIDYDTNTVPNAPTNLQPTGDAVRHTGSSVTLTGTRSDADSGDYIKQYQVQIVNDAQNTTYHDSTNTLSGTPTTFSKTVSGLPTNAFLKWRARTSDKAGAWGAWSSYQRFKLNTVPSAPALALQESPTTDVKTLTPTFKVTHSDPDPGDSNAHVYQIELQTSAGGAVWNSGEITLGSPVATVSKLYNGSALSWGASYRWRARTQDAYGQWSSYSNFATFTTHMAGAPISLSPTGVTGGITPTFSGSRATSADSLTSAQIEVYDSSGLTLIWDSGMTSSGVTTTGFSRAYGGTTLTFATSYKWRARITSSVGGVSGWSSLQSFSTPAANVVQASAPVGSGITTLTPVFQFSRTDSFNAYQIILMSAGGSTLWDSGTQTHMSATSRSITYPGSPPLAWATSYKWKVRVSSDSGSTWGAGYTNDITFATEEAGVPSLLYPKDDAWLGAPYHVATCDSLTGVTGNAFSTVTLDTSIKTEGAAALKATIASHTSGTTSIITIARALDLSSYGAKTKVKADVRVSSLTNMTNLRIRFTDSGGAWREYNVKPSGTGSFETLSSDLGSSAATSGTINWANIVSVILRLQSSATISPTIYLDDVRVDATKPSFDGDSSESETIDTVQVLVYASDQTTLVWDSGDVSVDDTKFSVAYDGDDLEPGATYYWTARYTEDAGPTGGFAPLRAFSLNAPPSAPAAMWPSAGEVIGDNLAPFFEAVFADPDLNRGDIPTVLVFEVYRNGDDALMHTLRLTDPQVGANYIQRTTEGSALSYEVEYKYRARYADAFGEYGAWSGFRVFKPSQSPTITISDPGAVNAPAFDIAWSFSSPGGKAQNRYQVQIVRTDDEVQVYDSGVFFSSVSSHSVPAGFLINSTEYTIIITVADSEGLSGVDDQEFETSWAAPDAVSSFSLSALEETSEVLLSWSQSTLSPSDFSYYQIYRRFFGDSAWTKYARITDQFTTEFSDFYAGHSLAYEYKVTVFKRVAGDVDIESSDSEIPSAILDPDTWFVIGSDRDPSHCFELPVTDENHTEPIQQEVFEPLGSKRKSIVRGKVLGAEGTVEVEWKNSELRDAHEQLEFLKNTEGPHVLKSPFGDVWIVSFSGPAKRYKGGGRLATSLSWIEVA